jgi:hypothetical protein
MEKKTLATLVATSILSALSAEAPNVQDQCKDSCIHEIITPFSDMHTCGQCNKPNRPIASRTVDNDGAED